MDYRSFVAVDAGNQFSDEEIGMGNVKRDDGSGLFGKIGNAIVKSDSTIRKINIEHINALIDSIIL